MTASRETISLALAALLLGGCSGAADYQPRYVYVDPWQPTYLGTQIQRPAVPIYPMVEPSRIEPMASPYGGAAGRMVQTPYAPLVRP